MNIAGDRVHEPGAQQREIPVVKRRLRDGSAIRIREIRPDDETRMVLFHEKLSDRSVYLRYFAHLSLERRTNHARLARICIPDRERAIVLVAVCARPQGAEQIVAVGRLCKTPGRADAEFALLVADPWQRRGLGRMLLEKLVEVGRAEGVVRIYGVMLGENRAMRLVCERAGFRMRVEGEGPELIAEMELRPK